MNYTFLKLTCLTSFLLFVTFFSNAQSNYFKWSYGFGAGVNYSNTDVIKGNFGHTFSGNIDHHFTPFVTGGLEGQYGLVQGGNIVTDPHNRQFVNKYMGINANIKFALGEFINYNKSSFIDHIKGLYTGIGIGAIKNNITDIVRYKPSWAAENPGYGPFPGQDKSVNLWIPINLGLNFYFNDGWGYIRYALNFNVQSSLTFGGGLDGYKDLSNFKDYDLETYNACSIGFKYYLGNTKVYHKSL